MVLDLELGSEASLDGFLAKGKPAPVRSFAPIQHSVGVYLLLFFLEKVLPVGAGKASLLGGNRRRGSTNQQAHLPAEMCF